MTLGIELTRGLLRGKGDVTGVQWEWSIISALRALEKRVAVLCSPLGEEGRIDYLRLSNLLQGQGIRVINLLRLSNLLLGQGVRGVLRRFL